MIKKKKGRPHVMRLSSKRDLVFDADDKKGLGFAAMSSSRATVSRPRGYCCMHPAGL